MTSPTLQPPAGPLTDGVVLLRPIADDDVDQITLACQDPRLQRYIPIPRPYERAHAEEYVTRSHREWAAGRKAVFTIAEPEDPAHLLGLISMSIAGSSGNCAYWVAPDARGRGVARRALRLLTDWAFATLPLAVVLAEINEANVASGEVARAAGFHRSHRIDVPDSATGEHTRMLYLRLVSDPPPAAG